MGKNNRKNRKIREQQAFLDLYLERETGAPPRRVTVDVPDPETFGNDEAYEIDGALRVLVDKDLDVPDVKTSDLSAPKTGRPRTKTTDTDRYFEWQLQRELKRAGATLDSIPRKGLVHVRSHEQLCSMVQYFLDLSSIRGVVTVGYDTEGKDDNGNPAMVQLSATDGTIRSTYVVQLHSKLKTDRPKDIFSEENIKLI